VRDLEIAGFLRERGILGGEISVSEIGDGNINYIFRARNGAGESVIVKYADELLRSSGRPLSVERARIEARALAICGELAGAHVPAVFCFDEVRRLIVMEDLADFENLRHGLLARKIYPTLAADLAAYLANTLIRTSDCILDGEYKKALVKEFINPEMCLISEKLIFTDPFTNFYNTNIPLEENREFYDEQLYGDIPLRLEAAKLTADFKTRAQALLHGDLHTGSVFAKPGATKIIDPEFAFFGPIGFDAGNIIANLIFAKINAYLTMAQNPEKTAFIAYMDNTIQNLIDGFYDIGIQILENEATDPMARTPGFARWYMGGIMADIAGMAGMELIRRTIGDAKVADINGIADIKTRARAERICILIGKKLILGRNLDILQEEDYGKYL